MSRTHGRVRRRAAALAAAIGLLVPAACLAGPASASSPGSAYASNGAVFAQPGFMVTTTTSGILAPVNWLTNGIVSPIVSSLTNLSPTLGVAFTDALVNAGLRAIASTAHTLNAPASGFPDSCAANGWDANDCYGPETPDIGAFDTVELGSGLSQGFATATPTGFLSRAQIADPQLAVLGVDLASLGTVTSQASCTLAGVCSGTHSLTDTKILDGLIDIQSWSPSGVVMLSIAGGPTESLDDITKDWTALNSGVDIKASQDTMYVRVDVTLPQLLDGLNLGGLLDGVSGLVTSGTHLSLTLSISSGSTVHSDGSVEAYGARIGLDLSGDIELSLLGGLSAVDIGIPTGMDDNGHFGNLLDFDVAYSNAEPGDIPSGSQWVPPGLH